MDHTQRQNQEPAYGPIAAVALFVVAQWVGVIAVLAFAPGGAQ